MSLFTSTIVVAGCMLLKNSACALPMESHSSIFVVNILVLTISDRSAFIDFSASSIFRIIYLVCSHEFSIPIIFPLSSIAVVPNSKTRDPDLTNLEYPTFDSQGVPGYESIISQVLKKLFYFNSNTYINRT